MRPRILWLSHFIPYPPLSGAVQRSYQLLRRIAPSYEVTVLALNRKALLATPAEQDRAVEQLSELGLTVEVHRAAAESGRIGWLGMLARSAAGRRPLTVNWLASESFARARRAALESGRFDLVHVDTIALADELLPSPLPVILNHHNIESQMLIRRAGRTGSPVRRLLLRREGRKVARLERRVCPAVTTNLVVSALDGDRLNQVAPGARWTVVENGVDADWLTPGAAGNPHELVFSGTMSWYPNEDAMRFFLERIWPGLIQRDRRFRLTIVGRGPGPALRELVRNCEGVTLTGEVEDVRPYLQRAGIYVCPVRDGGGTRLKVLEAMAAGLPLVATGLAMEGLTVEPGRHFLPAEDPHDFVECLLKLRDQPATRLALGQAGRSLVSKRYSWEVCGLHLDSAYRDAIAQSARQPAGHHHESHGNEGQQDHQVGKPVT